MQGRCTRMTVCKDFIMDFIELFERTCNYSTTAVNVSVRTNRGLALWRRWRRDRPQLASTPQPAYTMAHRAAPHRVVLVAMAVLLLVRPARPQLCDTVCDGVCGSPCCTLFAAMNTACRQQVAAHILTPWAPCTEQCLDRLEAMLRETSQGVSCKAIWEASLSQALYTSAAFPAGQHALYEGFLATCQDQRRARAYTPNLQAQQHASLPNASGRRAGPRSPPAAPPACSRTVPSHSCSLPVTCRRAYVRPRGPKPRVLHGK
jgi:hypothetical protein